MLALLAFLILPAAAGSRTVIAMPDGADSILVPDGSPVRFAKFINRHDAQFTGQFVMSGTYYYGDNEFNDTPDLDLTLYFVPDSGVWARLPRFKARGQPRVVFVANQAAFVGAVIPRERRTGLKKGGPYATGRASVLVDRLVVGIECDAPSFTLRFVAVRKQALTRVAQAKPDFGC